MADIGPTLREARIRARIDVTEVEARTKIRAKYLRAIENEEWERLPGPTYAKSFLRTYGDYLGLDSRMLVEEFKRRYERPAAHEPTAPMASFSRERDRERPRGPRGPLLPPWAPIGFVLVVIVAALFVVGTVFGGGNSSKSNSPRGIHAGTHRRARPPSGHQAPAPAKPQTATVRMVPTAPVYVCLVNGHGKKLINEQTFTPSETVPTEAGRKLLLTLGNANVQLKVNGHAVPLSQSSTAIRLLITGSGEQRIPSSMQPTCP